MVADSLARRSLLLHGETLKVDWRKPFEEFCFQAWGADDIYSMKVVVAPRGYEDMSERSKIDPLDLLDTLAHNSFALPSNWEAICLPL